MTTIDLSYRKLVEALVDRKIVAAGWNEQQTQLREALRVLYADVPRATDKLRRFLQERPSHEDLTYFDCAYLVECLLEVPELAGTNFFGQYSSPVMKKWQALLRMYKRGNVFVADAARALSTNAAYEIPFLKKAIQQNDKQVADNKRRILDLTKSIGEYKRKRETTCNEWGIAGNSFRSELQRLPSELPSDFDRIAKMICAERIEAAVAYHAALQEYLHRGDNKTDAQDAAFVVVSEPDVTSYTFFPAIRQLREASAVFEDHPVIDFEQEAVEISWDISLETDAAAGDTIDWGIETLPPPSGEIDLSTPAEIDWDITTDAVDLDVGAEVPAEIPEVSLAVEDPVADASTRVGLLTDNAFRASVLNDLLELKVFLQQRRRELSDSANIAFANQFQGTSPLLENQSEELLQSQLDAVEDAIRDLTSKRLQQLVLLKTSDRFLDRQVANLEMLTKHMDKCERDIKAIEDKNVDLVDATAKLQPQIDQLVRRTKTLKRDVEEALPPLFKGFKVNIVGDINSL